MSPEVIISIVTTFGTIVTGFFAWFMKHNSDDSHKKINDKMDELGKSTESINNEFKIIRNDMDAIKKINAFNEIRSNFIKDVNDILADAMKYSTNAFLSNYILYKGSQIKQSAVNIVFSNPEIKNINIEYLRGIIFELTNRINDECKKILGDEYAKQMSNASDLMIRKLESDVIEVINDKIFNDKVKRFFTLISNFIRDSIALNIREWNKMK